MNIERQNQGNFGSTGSSNLANISGSGSKFSDYIDHIHSARPLHLISALLQVVLGCGVIAGSITGFIQPLWFSTLASMLASITCMVGLYVLYSLFSIGNDPEQLIRNAMRRIMNSQN